MAEAGTSNRGRLGSGDPRRRASAVGIVIGAAFGRIVSSFVSDVLMPPIGLLLGGVDFSSLFLDLSGAGHATLETAKTAGAATINYGVFINTVLDFVIVAFA